MFPTKTYLDPATSSRLRFLSVASTLFVAIVIAVLLVIGVFALSLGSPAAMAEELGPDAPGSIAGVVTTVDGTPQVGIGVTLFNRFGTEIRTLPTQADGAYRFSLLPAGIYRIGVQNAPTGYAPLYYPTAPAPFKAAEISVVGNQVTGIDLHLQPAGQITGMVTVTQAFTTPSISVHLLQQGGLPDITAWKIIQTLTLSASGGAYTFTDLGADRYLVCADGFNFMFPTYECYDNRATIERAARITLTVGATVGNINLVLGDNADYPEIRGQVTSSRNEPLAGIDVYATFIPPTAPLHMAGHSNFVPAMPTDAASPRILDPNYSADVFARTDENGNYRLRGLNEGRYRLFFSDATGVYQFAYYNDALLLEQATLFDVVAGEVISNVNVQLEIGGQIYGAITLLGQPAVSGRVIAEMKTVSGWQPVANAPVEFDAGSYQIRGLPAGIYRVYAVSEIYDGATSYEYSGYFGGKTAATATVITVGAGEAKQADIILTGGPLFDGGVTGRVTAGGSPLAGAIVALYKGDNFCCPLRLDDPQVSVLTNQDGYYTINGLASGSYKLGVSDPTGIYATTYYTTHVAPAIANTLSIKESNVLTNVNLVLPLAGAVSGRVTTVKGHPVAGLSVLVYANISSERTVEFWSLVSSDARTDENGQYTIRGLHAGAYHVCFLSTRNILHCHGALYTPDPSSLVANALPVTLAAGETKTNVDLLWGTALLYYFPIVAR